MAKEHKSLMDIANNKETDNFMLFLIRNGYSLLITSDEEDGDIFVDVTLTAADGEDVVVSIYLNPDSISNCISKTIIRYLEDTDNDYYQEAQEMYGLWLAQ